jgi:uncharacterized membrane protein
VSIAAILLPYKLPDVFATSTVNQRVGKIPVISIIGVLSVIACAIMGWAFLADPMSGMTKPMIIFDVVIFLSGLVIYYIAKWVRARKGVDISLIYKELPSE